MKNVYNVWYGSDIVGVKGYVKHSLEDLVATFDSEEKVARYMRECVDIMRSHSLWDGEFIKDIPDGDIPMDTKIVCSIDSDRTVQHYFRYTACNVK